MKSTNLIRMAICLSLLIGQLAMPTPVSACSCVEAGAPVVQFTQYDAVFTGKVIAVAAKSSPVIDLLRKLFSRNSLYPAFLYSDRFWGNDVTFTVNKSWKGVTTTKVTIHTGSGEGDCGYGFIQGDDYLVYAYNAQNGDRLGASICSRTTVVSRAAEDLSFLNTMPTLPLTPVHDYTWLYITGMLLFVIAVCLLLTIKLIRRHRKRSIP